MLDDIDTNCLSKLIDNHESLGWTNDETNFIFSALEKPALMSYLNLIKKTRKT